MTDEPFFLRRRRFRNPVIMFKKSQDDPAEEFAKFDSRLNANFVESVAEALNQAFYLGYEQGVRSENDS